MNFSIVTIPALLFISARLCLARRELARGVFIYGISRPDPPLSLQGNFRRGLAGLRYNLKKTVVLVGMMGSGKTAIGSALARMIGVPFLDSDTEIVRAANMSIAEIFTRDGEAFFREKETQVITRLLESERGILSTGGGAFLADVNRKVISKKGVAVWLRAELDLLWNRVKHKNTRPLLRTPDPYATLCDLFAARNPVYQLAELAVDARADYSIEDMADRVIGALMTRPDVMEADQ